MELLRDLACTPVKGNGVVYNVSGLKCHCFLPRFGGIGWVVQKSIVSAYSGVMIELSDGEVSLQCKIRFIIMKQSI